MGHFLAPDDLYEVCSELEMKSDRRMMEIAAQLIGVVATNVAAKLNIYHSNTDYGIAGLLSSFESISGDTPCPPEIIDYDTDSEWADTTRGMQDGPTKRKD